MNIRIINCPKCNSTGTYTKEIKNPDTEELNCDALLGCNSCNNIWEGKYIAPKVYEIIKAQHGS